jgi:cytochrome c
MNRLAYGLLVTPLILTTAFGLSSCKDDDTTPPDNEPPVIEPIPEPIPEPPAPEPEPPNDPVIGDPVRGRQLSVVCSACHSFEENASPSQKLGPPLYGVYERDVAGVQGYDYSKALTELSGTWDEELLEQFLKSPQSVASGSKMFTSGLSKEQQIKDVVAYLKTLEDDKTSTLSSPAP